MLRKSFLTDPFVLLVTLTNEAWTEPVRLSTHYPEFVSRGQTYLYWPMEPILPGSSKEGSDPGSLLLANDGVLFTSLLRDTVKPSQCLLEIVSIDQPDTLLLATPNLEVPELTCTADVLRVPLVVPQRASRRYPADVFSPATFPGLVP
jgi:hypothetical protein